MANELRPTWAGAVSSELEDYAPTTYLRADEERGLWMRKARRGWTMPEEDARSMFRLIDVRIRALDIRVEHRDVLIRLRAMIEDDLRALERQPVGVDECASTAILVGEAAFRS